MRPRPGTVLALLLLAAACGPLPQPFQHGGEGAAYPLAELAIDVRVAAVGGLSPAAGLAVARAVAENLGGYGVTATARPGAASRFVLEGFYADVPTDAAAPDERLIVWTLFDADGEATGIHTQAIDDPATWDPIDAEAIRVVGAAPAKALAALVGVDAELPVAAAGDRRGVFLAGIGGAPGDGDTALAMALRQALDAGPFDLADTADGATHVVRGTVVAGPPADGSQRIEIVWRVTTPDGREVGEARQENVVPAGRLDRRWGAVAGLAARAAAEGIAEVLKQVRETERLQTTAHRPSIVLPPSSHLPPPEP